MLKNLDIYLNDHLAGAVAALELLTNLREQHKDEPLRDVFGTLKVDIDADKEVLREVMRSLGIEESTVRQTGAWAAEKVARARLKIAGDQPGLVLALEGLIMGINGKRMLWRSLAVAKVLNPAKWNFEKLERRAKDQIERAEAARIQATQRAFHGASDQD
jgi:hypothetical protein